MRRATHGSPRMSVARGAGGSGVVVSDACGRAGAAVGAEEVGTAGVGAEAGGAGLAGLMGPVEVVSVMRSILARSGLRGVQAAS